MTRRLRSQGWLAAAVCIAAGAGLSYAPRVVHDRIRSAGNDGLRPGLMAAMAVRDRLHRIGQSSEVREHRDREHALAEDVQQWKVRAHAAAAQAAELREELQALRQEQPAPFVGLPAKPLFVPELVEARILRASSDESMPQAVALLDAGASQGVQPAQWVVEGTGLAVDLGDEDDISPDDPVLAGRTLLGRIVQAGRWTSEIQRTTDPGFRIHAKLIRGRGAEAVQGAEGLLAGAGDGRCRLELIPGTEPVEPGDYVFTAQPIPGIDEALYLGEVTAADLPPGSAHWTITVDPGLSFVEADRVQVVRLGLHPERTSRSAAAAAGSATDRVADRGAP